MGSKEGGLKAAAKNLANDPDFYKKIGSKGGRVKGKKTGFTIMSPEQRSAAGKKGGGVRKQWTAEQRAEWIASMHQRRREKKAIKDRLNKALVV